MGQQAAVGVLAGGVGKFHAEHRGLNRVEAAVEALVDIVVAAVGAVVGKTAYGVGEFGVGGRDASGVAEGADILGRIETECAGVTEGADGACAVESRRHRTGANGLGAVLDDNQSLAPNDIGHPVAPRHTAVKMYGHHGADAGANGRGYATGREVHGALVGVDEHRTQSGVGYGEHGGYVRVGGDNDSVTGIQAPEMDEGAESQAQGIESVAETHTAGGLAETRHVVLEGVDLGAADVASRSYHPPGGGDQGVGVWLVHLAEIEKRIFECHIGKVAEDWLIG